MQISPRKTFLLLIISMSGGFLLGLLGWACYGQPAAPVWFTVGGALFYHHLRWLRKINEDGDDVKIKSFS